MSHQVNDSDVGESVLIAGVFFESLLVLFEGSIEVLLVKESITLEFDLLRKLSVLDQDQVSLELVYLELA